MFRFFYMIKTIFPKGIDIGNGIWYTDIERRKFYGKIELK